MSLVDTSKKYNISKKKTKKKLPIIYLQYCINKMAVFSLFSKMPLFKSKPGQTEQPVQHLICIIYQNKVRSTSKNLLHTTKLSKTNP